ncbi:MAG: hypothetical protein ACTHU0_02125 [Kofleriaceae bacterium]
MTLLSSASAAARTIQAAAIAAAYPGGKIAFYSAPQRANADAAIGAAVKLAEVTVSALAEANGVITATIAAAVAILASGNAAWCVLTKADGSAPLDFTCGRNGYAADGVTVSAGAAYNVNLNSPVFAVNAECELTTFTITVPAAGT